MITCSDHSLQHSYSLIDCHFFRVAMIIIASGRTIPLNRNHTSPALPYNPSNKCAMRVFPRSQERPAPAISAKYAHRINFASFITQYIVFVNIYNLYLVFFDLSNYLQNPRHASPLTYVCAVMRINTVLLAHKNSIRFNSVLWEYSINDELTHFGDSETLSMEQGPVLT